DRVGAVLDQRTEPLLALPASLLGSDLFAPRSAEVERPEDGGPESLQMMLDDVVRRAGLDVLSSRFLVEAAGDDDERRVRSLEERDPQRVARAERRQRMIGENDVGRKLVQRRAKSALRVHAPGG